MQHILNLYIILAIMIGVFVGAYLLPDKKLYKWFYTPILVLAATWFISVPICFYLFSRKRTK